MLCFERYKTSLIINCVELVILVLFCFVPHILIQITSFFVIAIILCFAIRNAYALIKYPKLCKDLPEKTGRVYNWKSAGRKSLVASVVIKEEGKELCSPNYFYYTEATNMVGKLVRYKVIDETLLIFEILE